MRLYTLFEDAATDRAYREQAKGILQSLLDEIDNNGFSNFHRVRAGGNVGLRISSSNLGLEIEKPMDVIFIKSFRNNGLENFGAYAAKINTVFIFIDPYDQESMPIWERRDWYSVFIHETIHHLDSSRNPTLSSSSNDNISQRDYVNSSVEFNAFYQQAIAETEKEIERFRDHQNYNKVYELLFDDVEKFTKFVLGRLPNEIRRHMNEKYMRKFKKRVAQYYQTYKHEFDPY